MSKFVYRDQTATFQSSAVHMRKIRLVTAMIIKKLG